ncbi:hypothetical protein tb265_04340 [Gemmatimonadetes bacterium T265]|nr:hypothetical protein tb265_04340 [Gemmatimonadetes bacterium T265]
MTAAMGDAHQANVPTAESAPSGGLAVPAGVTQPGSVILVRGPVDVYGTVKGDVLTIAGDVVVHPGAHVDGTVASLLGHATRLDRTSAAIPDASAAPAVPPTLAAALGVPFGWFLLLAALGAAVATRADRQLRAVRELVEQHPARALGAGIAGQLLVVPVLVLIAAALAATLIGIVAIPLAVVVFIAAAAGLATLGFLAAAAVLGRALIARTPAGSAAAAPRSPRPVLFGLGAFLALWLLAGALAGVPGAALVTRTLAVAATWLALSAGFGAALLTRAGTATGRRRAGTAGVADTLVTERGVVPAWQTPTPIATLVAARSSASVPTGRLD